MRLVLVGEVLLGELNAVSADYVLSSIPEINVPVLRRRWLLSSREVEQEAIQQALAQDQSVV